MIDTTVFSTLATPWLLYQNVSNPQDFAASIIVIASTKFILLYWLALVKANSITFAVCTNDEYIWLNVRILSDLLISVNHGVVSRLYSHRADIWSVLADSPITRINVFPDLLNKCSNFKFSIASLCFTLYCAKLLWNLQNSNTNLISPVFLIKAFWPFTIKVK